MAQRRLTPLSSAALLLTSFACASGDIILGARGVNIELADSSGPAANDASGPGGGRTDAARFDARAGDSDDARARRGDGGQDAASPGGSGGAAKGSIGCGKQPPAVDTNIQVNGMVGNYIVDRPVNYERSRPYPLVLSFRGANVTAADFRAYLDLRGAVRSDGIVVTPDCLGDASFWDAARDARYIEELIAKLTASYCIDEQRIFAVGHGPGGQLASVLGCQLGEELRAIAPLTGGPPINTNQCVGRVAVWISQGNADPLPFLRLGRSHRDAWIQLNGCSSIAPSSVSPQPCVQYAGCEAEHPVVYCEYDGDINLPPFVKDGQAIWDFFRSLR